MDTKVWYIPAKCNVLEKNVGIYCRISSNDKEQLNSLVEQISALTRAVANVSQWRLCDAFIDICSAKGESKRKEFERMLQECEAHNISVILTKSISRFGRDTVDTLEALKRLKAAGTRVIFEEEHLDTGENDNELLISVLESFAQSENENRSENIRLGLSKRAVIGTSGLYTRSLYGYQKDKDGTLKIDEHQSKVVRDIFRWYMDGASVIGIIKKLSDAGILSPTGKEKWSKHSIEKMLANEKYTGTVTLLDSVTQDYANVSRQSSPKVNSEQFRKNEQNGAMWKWMKTEFRIGKAKSTARRKSNELGVLFVKWT